MIVWLNGAFTPAGARIDTADRGFLLGDGAFETIYVENGRCAFLAAHADRLRRGLQSLLIPPPAEIARLSATVAGLARRNAIEGPAVARVTVSRGPGPRGLAPPAEEVRPTMLIALAAFAPSTAPARLLLSARRRYSKATASAVKTIGGYTENMLALAEARASGADDALLLNEHGRVVCASAANVFVETAKGLATPSIEEGALAGIVRAELIDAARAHGVVVEERPVAPAELDGAALLLANSLIGLRRASLAGAEVVSSRTFAALEAWYRHRLAADLAAADGGAAP